MKFLVLLVVSLVAAVSAGRSLVSLATKQDLKDAISKGSPIWNHGDIQGCVDLYTAAAEKHAAAEPVLAAALEAMKGQATDTQGWTLRKAMDAVLRMATTMDSPGAAAASAASTPALPVSEVVTDIEDAIARGVPLWNAGSVAAATALYYTVARAHASSEPHLAYGLAKAEKAARVCPSRTSQGWLLRRAMDRVLAAVADASPASDMVKEISTEAPMMVDAINEAIGKGIAMWNSGDVAGCTKTYRHTVEQFSEEEPLFAQALKDAKGAPVDRSHGGQGWIFRRAFDKVLAQCRKISSGSTTKSASSSSSSTPSSTWISSGSSSSYSASSSLPSSDSPSSSETHAMQSAIRAAITKGSQMWNHGDRAGCVREYMATAQKYASLSPRLAAAIKEAKGQSTSKQGWTLRRGFDDVLAHGAGGMGRGGAFGSWIWILACCVFVGVVGAAVRSACLKRRVRGGQRVAVVVGAEGAQNGAVVPMVAVAKMDPNQGGAGGLASAVIVDGRAVMSITVLQAHEETDLDMDGHMDLEAVEAVGGGGASVAVQAIVIATGARSGAAGGAGGVGGGAAAGEPMMLAHALP